MRDLEVPAQEMFHFDQDAFQHVSLKRIDDPAWLLTRGSAITPGVPVWMTLCTNLIQHTRTPAAAVSHRRSIFDLMAAIFSQADVSPGLLMLDMVWASKKVLSESHDSDGVNKVREHPAGFTTSEVYG